MAFFSDEDLEQLRIEQMVFHLVGPQDDHFVPLEAIDPGQFEAFFIERIRSINEGLPYRFTDASATETRLRRIADNPGQFQRESEGLAQDFQRLHGGNAAAGAFLVFVLGAGNRQAFALLKYDDEEVLAYDIEDAGGGRKRVNLEALERTFVQNREALQKSALVRLDDGGGELTVLDRRNQQKVALYFENFLAAVRVHGDAELTEKFTDVTRKTILNNRDLVPDDVYRSVTQRIHEAAAQGGSFDADEQKQFLDLVVGRQLPDDDPLVEKWEQGLRRKRIDQTPVQLEPAVVPKPSLQLFTTESGIRLTAPIEHVDRIDIEADRIIIHDRIKDQHDDTDGHR
ncbi:MAG: nucleoid-associated protein [Geminicoccaceae bacterium]